VKAEKPEKCKELHLSRHGMDILMAVADRTEMSPLTCLEMILARFAMQHVPRLATWEPVLHRANRSGWGV
jgi:hypothetical protein